MKQEEITNNYELFYEIKLRAEKAEAELIIKNEEIKALKDIIKFIKLQRDTESWEEYTNASKKEREAYSKFETT